MIPLRMRRTKTKENRNNHTARAGWALRSGKHIYRSRRNRFIFRFLRDAPQAGQWRLVSVLGKQHRNRTKIEKMPQQVELHCKHNNDDVSLVISECVNE